MKKKPEFIGPQFYPRGTEVEYKASGPYYTITVDHVRVVGPGSYVLVSNVHGGPRVDTAVNTVWVTKILKRGTGPTILKGLGPDEFDFWTGYNRYCNDGGLKSKNEYKCWFDYVNHLVHELAPRSENLNVQSLTDALIAQGVIVPHSYKIFTYYTASKKKLKRAIHQQWTKHLTPMKTLKKVHAEFMAELYSDSTHPTDMEDLPVDDTDDFCLGTV